MQQGMNLVGAVTGLAYLASCILLFLLRIAGVAGADRAVGFFQAAFMVPLVLLLVTGPGLDRPPLFYVQAGLLLGFVAFELVVDTILKIDFRSNRQAVIAYVVFFFAATGGSLGIIGLAGAPWLFAGIAAFLASAGLAFAQRALTGQ
jgi:hypothetical protein